MVVRSPKSSRPHRRCRAGGDCAEYHYCIVKHSRYLHSLEIMCKDEDVVGYARQQDDCALLYSHHTVRPSALFDESTGRLDPSFRC